MSSATAALDTMRFVERLSPHVALQAMFVRLSTELTTADPQSSKYLSLALYALPASNTHPWLHRGIATSGPPLNS